MSKKPIARTITVGLAELRRRALRTGNECLLCRAIWVPPAREIHDRGCPLADPAVPLGDGIYGPRGRGPSTNHGQKSEAPVVFWLDDITVLRANLATKYLMRLLPGLELSRAATVRVALFMGLDAIHRSRSHEAPPNVGKSDA